MHKRTAASVVMAVAALMAATRRRDDVNVITANPKTAGVARWIFLALWGVKAWKHGDKAAKEYVTKVCASAGGGTIWAWKAMAVQCRVLAERVGAWGRALFSLESRKW